MKKTLNINLSRLVFNIDEDAYALLKEYLDGIAHHFEKEAGKEDIMNDIENRIAEEFTQKKTQSKEAISKEDVENIIKTMGRVEDFSDEKSSEKEVPSSSIPKRLYRDKDHAVLGGVASGIAKYFGVDPVFIRGLFVLFTFAGGFAIPLYIILWIITPEAETPLQKAEMTGEPITIKTIEEQVKKVVEEGKEKIHDLNRRGFGQRLADFIQEVVSRIWMVFGKFFLFLSALIGFALTAGAFVGIIGLGVAAGTTLLYRNSPELGIQIHNYLSVPEFFLSVFFIAGAIFFPLLGLLFLGLRLLKRRSTFNTATTTSLTILWAICLIGSGVMFSRIIPSVEKMNTDFEQQNADTKTLTYDIKDFDSLDISGYHSLQLKQGPVFSIEASGREWELNNLHVEKITNTLHIDQRERFNLCIFCSRKRVDVVITAPTYKSLDIHGANSVTTDGISGDALDIRLSGASTITGTLDIKSLTVDQSGATEVKVQGKANKINLEVSGASHFEGLNFTLEEAQIDVNGASSVELLVKKSLIGEVSGASHLKYSGNPPLNRIEVTGASSVRNLDTNEEQSGFEREMDAQDFPLQTSTSTQ